MEALHSSTKMDSTQFYIGCAQLKITGSGSGNCGPTIQIPGAYKAADTNIYISNFYYGFQPTTFKAPGGPLATCGRGGPAPKATGLPAPAEAAEPETPEAPAVTAAASPTAAPAASRTTSQRTRTRPTRTRAPESAESTEGTEGTESTESSESSESNLAVTVSLYGRCGGEGYDGPTECEAGAACVEQNQYYSQCVAA
jgi:cellulase